MSIFIKIYKDNKQNALKDILKIYKEKGYVIVNYIYFANFVSNGIIGNKKVNNDFLKALNFGDFLLPDGIALKLYYKKFFGFNLPNLNGTDFCEYLFSHLKKGSFNLVLYGSKKNVIKKATENISKKYDLVVNYYQEGYSEFNFESLELLPKGKMNILMVGLGTPKQEIWVKNNIDIIKKYNLLVFTQGGTFDFWGGEEKRAPKIFLILKLEWLRRFITNPKKNVKKVWYSFYLFYFLYSKKNK